MATSFDGPNLTITLDPVVNGVKDISIQDDLYEPWKEWVRSGNAQFPAAFRPLGGDPLSSIINAGSYFFLNNIDGWRIKPYENDGTYYLSGNLAVEDTTLPAFKETSGGYTTAILGLQPVTQGVTEYMDQEIQYASFNGSVTIDTTSSYSGTGRAADGKIIGTPRAPVNNIDDAYLIAIERGFNTFSIISNLTLTSSSPNLDGFVFIGASRDRVTISINSAANVNDCTYYDAHVTGTLDGDSKLKDCLIDNLTYIKGYIEQCVLAPGTIVLGGNDTAHFLDCWSGIPGAETPIIDMGGSGQSLALRNYNGGIKLINKTGTEPVSIDLNSGQVKLGADVIAGTVVLRGVGSLTEDLSSGTTIINQLIDGNEFKELYDITSGKWKIANNEMIFYKSDNTTEIAKFSLFDSSGNPSMSEVFERVRI